MSFIGSAPAGGAPQKIATLGNFVDLKNSGWAQQYLPELVEQEAQIFGNRSVSGFLDIVGAEEAMQADQVIWSEQGRLHISFSGTTHASTVGKILATAHKVRVGDTVIVSDADSTVKCYVTAVATNDFDVAPYTAADLAAAGIAVGGVAVKGFVFGSEYKKGTDSTGRGYGIEPTLTTRENYTTIMKDKFTVSGSDAAAIGWIEVAGEEGQGGYYWYVKGASETSTRFGDYCEMSCIEDELAAASSGADAQGLKGSEGLFAAIETRGNVFNADAAATPTNMLADIDLILQRFDTQGAIEENTMFLNRAMSIGIDDMLAGQSTSTGASFGLFDNNEDMALNLGFNGFRRGSYDFYKSDWKYLNDFSTRANLNDTTNPVLGVIAPAGMSSVYDQMLGKNVKRPFLHVRYRASQTENRNMKIWTTGSVGAATSDLDAMEIHYLTERCLVTQGANNFVILK